VASAGPLAAPARASACWSAWVAALRCAVVVQGAAPPGVLLHDRVDLLHLLPVGHGSGDTRIVRLKMSAVPPPESIVVRADASHLLGNFSNGWLATVGLAHIFMPQWRVSPFVGIGGGVVHISPKSTLVQPEDRTDEAAYAGLGLRGFLTDRFLVQAEYRKFQVFTSRDENEEPDSWTVAFTYFF
jgi:hypothetical protein